MADEMQKDLVLTPEDILRENRSLKRQLRNAESLLQRNKAMLAARNNINALLTSQQVKMEKSLNLLLENSPDIILLFDHTGRFSYCTNTFLAATHIVNFGPIIGHHFTDVFRKFTSDAWLNHLETNYNRAMQEHRTVIMAEEMAFSSHGPRRNYSIHITPMLAGTGEPEGAMMLFHDLTDMVKAKEAAEAASNAKTDFLATMSHEMRTPLNAIIGMTHIAHSAETSEKKERALDKIDTASRHLLGVINDILDMSKIESGKLELHENFFSFEKMLAGATNVIAYRVDEKRQHFLRRVDPAVPADFIGDEQRLWQVITNLLSNAVKFTPEKGVISLAVDFVEKKDSSCKLRVSVSDTGIGISKEHQKKLFQSFMQADSSVSRRFGGTGLGLVISKNIVEMLGGEIQVDSEENKGACFSFTVWLKLAGEAVVECSEKSEFTAVMDHSGIFSGRRILLAEDIDVNREIVVTLLEPTGAIIDEALNGHEACGAFEESGGAYDIILMDIHMPEMDGYEATRRIRASTLPSAKTVPIVAMTANVFKEDVARCMEAGMNSHLGKPIMVEEMISAMSRYLV